MQKLLSSFAFGLLFTCCLGSLTPALAQVEQEKETRSKFNRREAPVDFNKNSASEFGSFFGFALRPMDDLNQSLRANNAPTFNSFVVGPVGFSWLKTFGEGWAVFTDIAVDIDQRREDDFRRNRLTYTYLKGRFGKDVLQDEAKRLVPFLGASIGGINLTSAIRNPEAISFDDITGIGTSRNVGALNGFVLGLDLGFQMEWLSFTSSSSRRGYYRKEGLALAYHYPVITSNRSNIINAPDLRPEGVYMAYSFSGSRIGSWR